MLKGLPTRLFAGLVVLLAAFCSPLSAQSDPCPPTATLLSVSDPAYVDAMKLAQRLESHDFKVQCIFPTKFGSVFMVEQDGVLVSTIEGEACFRTNFGDIGVLFAPKPQTFTEFKIAEHRARGGYLYRFSGTPRVRGGNKFKMETVSRKYFLKRENQLFILGDDRLLSRLEDALPSPAP